MSRHPGLAKLTPKDVRDQAPELLFRSRLKGYCRAPALCRIWVLEVFDELAKRGEFFCKHYDSDGELHNGLHVFSHLFTIKYMSIHEPSLSVLFHLDGGLKSTSVIFQQIRAYVWAYSRPMARRFHDMHKQRYELKTHAVPAWKPLRDFLTGDPTYADDRCDRVRQFKKTDADILEVIAKCSWSLARAAHHPWGIGAIQPQVYSDVHVTKKVVSSQNTHAVAGIVPTRDMFFFFLFIFFWVTTCEHLRILPHVCIGLGSRMWDQTWFEAGPYYEHGEI